MSERPSPQAIAHASQELRRWLETLDLPHLRFAAAYADHLATGEVEPDAAGLDRALVREIRRRVFAEWRRRVWSKRS